MELAQLRTFLSLMTCSEKENQAAQSIFNHSDEPQQNDQNIIKGKYEVREKYLESG